MLLYNNNEVKIDHYPDGTILLKQKVDPIEKTHVEWRYENDEELVALMFLTNHLRAHGVKDIYLTMLYVPNARMDRIKNDEDVFTLKYFANIINSLNFKEVRVMDTHSSVTDALINNIAYINHIEYIKKAIDAVKILHDDILIFYPDQGSVKRYADDIGKEYAFGIKNRDWSTGKILGLDVGGSVDKIQGNNILIVDDICSRGGTFFFAAKKLKELGAKNIYLYVSHCENTIFDGELIKGDLINHIYTTNSLITKTDNKITVFDVE
jgi:ribose-phosphate pyrophosphokinase